MSLSESSRCAIGFRVCACNLLQCDCLHACMCVQHNLQLLALAACIAELEGSLSGYAWPKMGISGCKLGATPGPQGAAGSACRHAVLCILISSIPARCLSGVPRSCKTRVVYAGRCMHAWMFMLGQVLDAFDT